MEKLITRKEAAARLDFEVAAVLRDKIRKLKSLR